MDGIYKNVEEYNLGKEHEILTVFGDIIPDILNNQKI